MSILIKKKSKETKHVESVMSRVDSEQELTKELTEEDKKIVGYIRNGIENHEGISLSQELCIHRKKILGIINDDEWNDYVDFVNKCIQKGRE